MITKEQAQKWLDEHGQPKNYCPDCTSTVPSEEVSEYGYHTGCNALPLIRGQIQSWRACISAEDSIDVMQTVVNLYEQLAELQVAAERQKTGKSPHELW